MLNTLYQAGPTEKQFEATKIDRMLEEKASHRKAESRQVQ